MYIYIYVYIYICQQVTRKVLRNHQIASSLGPKWRHFAPVYIADIFMLSSKLSKQIEMYSKKKTNPLEKINASIQASITPGCPTYRASGPPAEPWESFAGFLDHELLVNL